VIHMKKVYLILGIFTSGREGSMLLAKLPAKTVCKSCPARRAGMAGEESASHVR